MKVTLNVSEADMDAIEDIFFCALDTKSYEKIKPRLLRIWKRLCDSRVV